MELTIHVGEKRSVHAGPLRFDTVRREIGDIDGGISIEVWAEVEGEPTQVVRFDCFRKGPHYHTPPSAPGQRDLDPAQVGDGVEWALSQVAGSFDTLVREAGFAELAARLSPAELARAATELREVVAQAPAPHTSYTVEVPTPAAPR